MSVEERVEEILERVARAVTPSREERERLDSVLEKVVRALEELRGKYSIDYAVEIVGSYAKDTWLSGEADIDVFLLFSPEVPEEEMGVMGLRIAREAVARLGGVCLEKYAAHPYVEAHVEGVTMDIVPAYRVQRASEIISPVDRTPFHTRYVAQRLNEDLRREVRLLKKFMKGIGVYGAEIRVQGFSGYLVELLVLYYGSFLNVLREARSWRPRRVFIDLEGYYGERERKRLLKTMPGAMVVVDPVDKSRNVASALSIQRFCEFVAAARVFLEKPSIHFFFPPPLELRDEGFVREVIERRGTDIVALVTRLPPMPEDIAWGQIYKSLEGLARLLERHEFRVYGTGAWLGGDGTLVMLFELESSRLPAIEKHCGPPVGSKNERDFLEKLSLIHI